MKKFYFMALAAMSLLTFTACGDDESNSNTPNEEAVPTFAAAPTAEDAAIYTFDDTEIVLGGETYRVCEIEVTEDNEICFKGSRVEEAGVKEFTRAGAPMKYMWYTFNKEGDALKIVDFGTIIFKLNGQKHLIELAPTGMDPMEIIANGYQHINPNDTKTQNLCRSWEIVRYRILANISGREVGRSWQNGPCDLVALIKWAKDEHGIEIDSNLGKKQVVSGIRFTTNGTFDIKYAQTTDVDNGKWAWGESQNNLFFVGYQWNDADMGNDFLGGVASVKFNADETCRFTLYAKEDISNNVRIEFDLK